MLKYIFGYNLVRSFTDNVFKEKATPVPGSIVYCNIAMGMAQHSGIYVGYNEIIHLDGSGKIERVNPEQFLARINGLNVAMDIYISCDSDGESVGNFDTVDRGEDMLGAYRNYNLILDNCHQFSSGCITGDFENSDNFLWMLKSTAENFLDATKWLVWDTIDGEYY